VRRRVDTERAAGNHLDPDAREASADVVGDFPPERRTPPRADHGDAVNAILDGVAAEVEPRRRIVQKI
jgi:hypothetical protein